MERDDFDGLLELTRLAVGLKNSKSDVELFTEHNRRVDAILRKLDDAIYWVSSLYAYEFKETRGSLVQESLEKASNLPYNGRSTRDLYLDYPQIQRELISEINMFLEDSSDQRLLELAETVFFTLDRLETTITKLYEAETR